MFREGAALSGMLSSLLAWPGINDAHLLPPHLRFNPVHDNKHNRWFCMEKSAYTARAGKSRNTSPQRGRPVSGSALYERLLLWLTYHITYGPALILIFIGCS
jgi:hypothetical protein